MLIFCCLVRTIEVWQNAYSLKVLKEAVPGGGKDGERRVCGTHCFVCEHDISFKAADEKSAPTQCTYCCTSAHQQCAETICSIMRESTFRFPVRIAPPLELTREWPGLCTLCQTCAERR